MTIGLSPKDLTIDWAQRLVDFSVTDFHIVGLQSSQAVMSRYSSSSDGRLLGLFRLSIFGTKDERQTFILKVKPQGRSLRQGLVQTYLKFDSALAQRQTDFSLSLLDRCHLREAGIYRYFNENLTPFVPQLIDSITDEKIEIYAIVLEDLKEVRHLTTFGNLDVWTFEDIAAVLRGIGTIHGAFLGQTEKLTLYDWLEPFDVVNSDELLCYQKELLRYWRENFTSLIPQHRFEQIELFQNESQERRKTLLRLPMTLLHGDLTPRNLCLRTHSTGDSILCAYDWELAQIGLPHRDFWEFLCYVLNPQISLSDKMIQPLIRIYHEALLTKCKSQISERDLAQSLKLSLVEFVSTKMLVQGITHQILKNQSYFQRLLQNAWNALDGLEV